VNQQVSCRIASSIIAYTIDQKKNVDRLLEDLAVSQEYLQDTNSWISFDLAEILFDRLENLFFDQNILYKVGRRSSHLGSWGVLDSVFRMIGDPRLIFHQSRKFISYFYKNIQVRVIEKSDFHVRLKFSGESLNPRHLQYLRGSFESIPTYWQLGSAFSEKTAENIFEFRWENKQEFFGKKDTQVSLSPQLIQDTIIQLEKTVSLIEKKNRQLEEKNEELVKINKKLKETVKEKIQTEKMASVGQLATGVAHEINNPLGFVISNLSRAHEYVEQLKTVISSDQMQQNDNLKYVLNDFPKLIKESQEGLDRIHKIIADLNSFAKSGPDAMDLEDIHVGLDSTLNLLSYELKKKANVIKKYGEIPKVRCNLSRLNQVFLNILMNANQAIQEKGDITIETAHENKQVTVKISATFC